MSDETLPDPTGLPLFADLKADPSRSRLSTLPHTAASTSVALAASQAASPVSGVADIDVDWKRVAILRSTVSALLSERLGEDRGRLSTQAQQELGRTVILEAIDDDDRDAMTRGEPGLTAEQKRALAGAVFDAVFRMGRLQPLLDDEQVENIIITGSDQVLMQYEDGRLVKGSPVADSDQELVEQLAFIASRSEGNPRPFSETVPSLHMKLDDGSRLAAAAWISARPQVVIRRQRVKNATLDDLVGRNMLSPVAASFLEAAVKAEKSIVVAGPQGAGKTTLVRALCSCIGPDEIVGTFETEYELLLHELPQFAGRVQTWEARPGSGEFDPSGRQAGEFTLDQALYDSFRHNLNRQIVGEVRGREILAMIKAMNSGTGSISTTHSANATDTIIKLIQCALEAGPQVTEAYATSALARSIDIIVQIHLRRTPGQTAERWVSEIVAIEPGEPPAGYATTHIFRPAPSEPAVPGTLPDHLRELASYGFDLDSFHAAGGGGR